MKKIIDDSGLTCISSHYGMGELRESLENRIEWATQLGMKQMVASSFWLPEDASIDEYRNAADELKMNDKIEVVDLRTLSPLDMETVTKSVKKCGKCLVITEEPVDNTFGRALSGKIQEECFKELDAPEIRRAKRK